MAAITGVSARANSYIAIGIQSAKGTPASNPTNKAFFAAAPSLGPIRAESRYSMTDGAMLLQGDPYTTGLSWGGSVTLYAHPEILGLLWHGVMGTDVDTGAGDPYTHTITLSAAKPWFTVWTYKLGSVSEKATDVQITSLALSGKAGEPLQVTLDLIGLASTHVAENTSVDPTTTTPLMFMDGAGALKVATVAYPMHSIDLTVNNNLQGFQADSYLFDNIDPNGTEISGSYGIRFASSTAEPIHYRDHYYASSQTAAGSGGTGTIQTITVGTSALSFIFTQATNSNRSLSIAIPFARWADSLAINPDPAGGTATVDVAFEVMKAGYTSHVENTPMTVVVVDGNATV